MSIDREYGMIDSLLHRPGMYTVNGTLEEAYCFYHAYIVGISHAGGSEDFPIVTQWYRFTWWLTNGGYKGQRGNPIEVYKKLGQEPDGFETWQNLWDEFLTQDQTR